ncbi:MAG: PIN domain-containing protein [Ardenticatenales bacterium]|nr:PIN domain-containing protein [Ardenticatenales bacterium]
MAEARMVLDTSAILTLLEDEPGAERVQVIIERGTAVIPWIVLLEAYYVSFQERGQDEADLRYALMKRLPVTFDDVLDEPRLLTAGRLKASHRLSLADAIIAAVTLANSGTLVHKDPEYAAIQDQVRQEALPFKG